MKLMLQYFILPLTLIYVLCFCFLGCSADEEASPSETLIPTGEELEQLAAQALDLDKLQTRGSSGEELFYQPNQETPYTGWVKDYHDSEDEDLRLLAQVRNGKFHGPTTRWYENGQKSREGTYTEGKQDGAWTFWYENGQKDEEGTYKDDELDGAWTFWYENGQKSSEGTYKDDERNGMWTFWYRENGQKSSEGTYKDDELDGAWTFWYENGQKIAAGKYKNAEGPRRDGAWTFWYENGQEVAKGTYADGAREGMWTFWYEENGQKWAEGAYKSGRRDGAWTFWHDNGQKSAEGTYTDGIGINWRAWDEDGQEWWGRINVRLPDLPSVP